MGAHHHPTRRELLESIPVLGAGSLLLPLGVLKGQAPDTRTPAIIRGALQDGSGEPTAAKIRVVNTASGEAYFPESAIRTMPRRTRPGVHHYFYARDRYEVAVPPGRYRIEAVRGINHEAAVEFTEVGAGITHGVDFRIPLLKDVHAAGWRSGNTHTHYHLEIDEHPDDRLRMVPPAEALDVSVISYLIRNDAPYITNRYPIGRMPEFSKHGTLVDMGEEARNNSGFGDIGYGHCLFLNIPRLIEPVSTGLLSFDGKAPDFPTLGMACEEAQSLGGLTVWCHNGRGMEMPVAVALGHLDAFNLGDGGEPAYDRYYQLLHCVLPAGSLDRHGLVDLRPQPCFCPGRRGVQLRLVDRRIEGRANLRDERASARVFRERKRSRGGLGGLGPVEAASGAGGGRLAAALRRFGDCSRGRGRRRAARGRGPGGGAVGSRRGFAPPRRPTPSATCSRTPARSTCAFPGRRTGAPKQPGPFLMRSRRRCALSARDTRLPARRTWPSQSDGSKRRGIGMLS